MEAAVALSVAAAAVQFFDFFGKFLFTAKQMWTDGTDQIPHSIDANLLIDNMKRALQDIRSQNVRDPELRRLIERSSELGTEILEQLPRPITSHNKVKRIGMMLGSAIRHAFNKNKIEENQKRLNELKRDIYYRLGEENIREVKKMIDAQGATNLSYHYKTMAELDSAKLDHVEIQRQVRQVRRVLCGLCVVVVVMFMLAAQQYRNLRASTQQQTRESYEKTLSWLAPLDFAPIHQRVLSSRSSDTGIWFLQEEEYQAWKNSTTHELLWIKGSQGTGKTVMASIVIEDLLRHHASPTTPVAYVYCGFDDAVQQTPENLLSSIIRDLNYGKPLSNELQKIHRNHNGLRERPTILELETLLQQEISKVSSASLVIDAVDELTDDTRDKLLKAISTATPCLKIILTSRPHFNVGSYFENVKSTTLIATDQDIRQYVQERITANNYTKLARLAIGLPDLEAQIIETVVRKSQGMFLLAVYHMDLLADQPHLKGIRSALEQLPTRLNDAYRDTTKRITQQSLQRQKIAGQALQWLYHVKRPLTIGELQHALAVEPDHDWFDRDGLMDEEYLLSSCKGLVVVDEMPQVQNPFVRFSGGSSFGTIIFPFNSSLVPKQSDRIVRIVRLAHYSVHEYLADDRNFMESGMQTEIAVICVLYLLQAEYLSELLAAKSIFEFPVSAEYDVERPTVELLSEFPLLAYVDTYWHTHLRSVKVEALMGAFRRFLGDKAKPFLPEVSLTAYDDILPMLKLVITKLGLTTTFAQGPEDGLAKLLRRGISLKHFAPTLFNLALRWADENRDYGTVTSLLSQFNADFGQRYTLAASFQNALRVRSLRTLESLRQTLSSDLECRFLWGKHGTLSHCWRMLDKSTDMLSSFEYCDSKCYSGLKIALHIQ